jgi:O-antigen/teichoic acid export membrane protein
MENSLGCVSIQLKQPEVENHPPIDVSLSFVTLIRQNAIIFLLIYISYLLSFVFNVMLARWLGTEDFALVNVVMRVFGVLLPLLSFGVEGVLIKHVQFLLKKMDYATLNGMLYWTLRVFVLTSFIYFIVSYTLIYSQQFLPYGHGFDQELAIFAQGIWLPPLFAFMYIQSSLLRSLRSYYVSTFFAWTSTLIFSAIMIVAWHTHYGYLKVTQVFWIMGIGSVISILLQSASIIRRLPWKNLKIKPLYALKDWRAYAFYIMGSNTLSTVSETFAILLIDIIGVDKKIEIAEFVVCFVIANAFLMLTQATARLIGPWVGSLYGEKNTKLLQWLVNITNDFKLIGGMLFLLIIVLFGNVFLSWFGPQYTHLYQPLMILSVMNFIAICFGSSTSVLLFSSGAKVLDKLRLIQIAMLVVLGVILIRPFGVTGIIVASGLSLITFELLCTFYTKKLLNIYIFSV